MIHRILSLDDFTETLAGKILYQDQQYQDVDSRHKLMIQILKRAYLGELTSRQKDCLYLFYGQQKKMIEIADLLQIHVSTVSRHIRKAHQRLYTILSYYLPVKEILFRSTKLQLSAMGPTIVSL